MIGMGSSSTWLYLQLAVVAASAAFVCAVCGRLWRSDFYLWIATALVAAILFAAA